MVIRQVVPGDGLGHEKDRLLAYDGQRQVAVYPGIGFERVTRRERDCLSRYLVQNALILRVLR